MKTLKLITTIALLVFATSNTFSQVNVSGQNQGHPRHWVTNGMPSTVYCGSKPESWVRGNASLNANTGIVTVTLQLETDAVNAGPEGQVTVYLRDNNGKDIAKVMSDKVGRGGKKPGKAQKSTIIKTVSIGVDVAKKVASIYVVAENTGFVSRIFNIKSDDIKTLTQIFSLVASTL